ncbi:site-specific DNA-methyltransferase [Candidatus Peregrinibacteria bacterium]|jgi:site-specific DNA-methyltransferase (adenine-specific)|nr:site-specific DNA-methyltransferase [Candidatus Peregrinibacteria bacterium]
MIKLYNQDCMEALKLMEDNQFDLAIVDPPYGIGESGKTNNRRSKLAVAKDYGEKNWDDSPPTKEFFNSLKRVSKNQIIFGANHFISRMPYDSSCWIVWDKNNGKTDFADSELAWTSFKTAVRNFKFTWHGMIQQDMKNKQKRIHLTEKPYELYQWLLQGYAKKGDTILDTHLGSGSIALACHNLGFDLTGYEIDKEYFEAAKNRLEEHQKQIKLF